MKTIYRVESPTTGEGLWYAPDGTYRGAVTRVPGARCAEMPMEWDGSLALEGWRSGTFTLDEMRSWISREEVPGLDAAGLVLWRLRVRPEGAMATVAPYVHAVFLDFYVVSRVPLPWFVLYPEVIA